MTMSPLTCPNPGTQRAHAHRRAQPRKIQYHLSLEPCGLGNLNLAP